MRRRAVTLLIFAAALLWFRHYVPGLHTANEYVRLYSVLAMAEFGTARIDPVFDRMAPGWHERDQPPNVDLAVIETEDGDRHYYLDKAPLPSLLALPFHFLIRTFVDPWKNPEEEVAWLAFFLCGLPALVFLWFAPGRRRTPATEAAVLLFAMGSPLLLYGGLWFGHLTAGLFAYGGYTFLKRNHGLAGGLLLGAAVLCDYPAGVVALTVLAVHAFTSSGWRGRLVPMLGFLVALSGQAVYNLVVFDNPLVFAYAYKNTAQFKAIIDSGVFGIGLPDPAVWLRLLFGPERGLMFLSPILLLVIPGIVIIVGDRGLHQRERWLPLAILLVPSLVLSGFLDWKAGNCAGPRHLVSILPFLLAPVMASVERASGAARPWPVTIVLIFGTLGIAHGWFVRSTFPYLSTELANPVYHQVVPLFLDGCRYPARLAGLGLPSLLLDTLPVLLTLAVVAWWAAAPPAPGVRRWYTLVGALIGLALLPALATIDAGDPTQVTLAGREARLVQTLHECPRTTTATDLVNALGHHVD